ncbi:hypothetical protein C2S53_010763 [Perilla frutescens var. hirtella]|uniref:F-box domain-containing protein n=1 Tax=Perilla frutescens var. hirtella TaxID=608512 RepID=A0AAD4JNZ2_PERFH|nr:hypothetical protein C2S53_010763 [Perilla frutescens var. hirtella]
MECRNPRTAVPWPDLPPELLDKIAKRLPAEIDVRRFRSVCNSWRSSTPPYKFPTIKLPFPFDAQENSDPKHSGAYFTLTERIVYRIQLPGSKNPDFWLVKVELAENGKVRILNPVTHRKIEISPAIEMPKALNILDFDVSEVCKAYALRYVNPSKPDESDDYYDYRYAKKVVYSGNVDNGEYVVMAIDLESRLWKIMSGRKKWIMLRLGVCSRFSDFTPPFYDVAIVKGQFHATDVRGAIWALNYKLGWRTADYNYKRSRALKRRFVDMVDNGEVVLVEEMGNKANGPCARNFRVEEPVVDIRIYGLHKQLKHWVDAEDMNSCIIVVGDDCSFSVPTREELKAARVFYTDRYSFLQDEIMHFTGDYTCFECDCRDICNCFNDLETIVADDLVASDDVRREFEGFHGHNIGVCDCETGKTGTALMFPEYASIFWPPPAWLSRS